MKISDISHFTLNKRKICLVVLDQILFSESYPPQRAYSYSDYFFRTKIPLQGIRYEASDGANERGVLL